MHAGGLQVIHVTALGDGHALETLRRTTPVMAAAGVRHKVLALDDGTVDLDFNVWNRGMAAEARLLRFAGLSAAARVRTLRQELLQENQEHALYAVHLHGAPQCVIGARAVRESGLRIRVICSPHGQQLASPWRAALLARRLQLELSTLDFAVLVSSVADAEMLSRRLRRLVEVLVYPVSKLYYALPRSEDERATVMAAGSGLDVVELVTRLSVLLNGRDERVCFKWMGPAGDAVSALQAAGVQVGPAGGDADCARELSRAWVFMHMSAGYGMPLAAAQAMAAGVPCLVSDTPAHRALVRHGETGFICASAGDFMEKLVLLMRNRDERERIGNAARAEARRRLAPQQFERALFRAYGFSGVATPRPRRLAAVDSLAKEDTP